MRGPRVPAGNPLHQSGLVLPARPDQLRRPIRGHDGRRRQLRQPQLLPRAVPQFLHQVQGEHPHSQRLRVNGRSMDVRRAHSRSAPGCRSRSGHQPSWSGRVRRAMVPRVPLERWTQRGWHVPPRSRRGQALLRRRREHPASHADFGLDILVRRSLQTDEACGWSLVSAGESVAGLGRGWRSPSPRSAARVPPPAIGSALASRCAPGQKPRWPRSVRQS